MTKYNKHRNKKNSNSLLKLAFNLGRIEKGKNGDTRVAEQFNKGLNYSKKKSKPLC